MKLGSRTLSLQWGPRRPTVYCCESLPHLFGYFHGAILAYLLQCSPNHILHIDATENNIYGNSMSILLQYLAGVIILLNTNNIFGDIYWYSIYIHLQIHYCLHGLPNGSWAQCIQETNWSQYLYLFSSQWILRTSNISEINSTCTIWKAYTTF